MRIYALRDKVTGILGYFNIILKNGKLPKTGWPDKEVVVFREEPTTPCGWCKIKIEGWMTQSYDNGEFTEIDSLYAIDWKFCPNCGRRLK